MKNHKMNRSKWSVLILTLFLGINSVFFSCENYLDIDEYIYDRTTIDSIFVSRIRLNEYINGTAKFLPSEGNIYRGGHSPAGQASDEFFASWHNDGAQAGTMLLIDEVTPESWFYNELWDNMYKGIRKANLIIERISECKELTDIERRDYTGRAHFLRGYFYYTLLRHYGPVPILPDKAFDTDEPAANVSFERDTWEECVEYICKDMERAGTLLPTQRERAFEFVPTSGAAYSVVARLRLYQASYWYNGNARYSTWTRTDGRHFMPQEHDPSRWGVAAAAFKRIIDSRVYKLHTIERDSKTLPLPENVSDAPFPDGAGDIDPYLSYKRIFDGGLATSLNPELIFYQPSSQEISKLLAPAALGGYNGFNIPLDFIESYRMSDGRQYNEATQEERSWEAIGARYGFSEEYTISENTAVRDAYREPRFYASIGYNHCIWPGTSYMGTQNVKNFEVGYYKDGSGAAKGVATDFNHTGYTSRKFFHQEDNYTDWNHRSKQKYAPVIRYAEILMGYVEAMNEMEGTYEDEATGLTVSRNISEMVEYFNMIRYRAGLPGITEADAADKNRMTELIRQERKVEFAFEAHRYYDLRRWGIAQEVLSQPIMGYNTSARTSERQLFYTPIILDKERVHRRVFNQKMYFYPIPKHVIERNRKIVQNPGWR